MHFVVTWACFITSGMTHFLHGLGQWGQEGKNVAVLLEQEHSAQHTTQAGASTKLDL